MKLLMGLWVACASPMALAHEGHGLGSNHWHATDTLGFVVLALIVAAALWASRRK